MGIKHAGDSNLSMVNQCIIAQLQNQNRSHVDKISLKALQTLLKRIMNFLNKRTVAVLQGRFFSSLQNGDFRNIPCSFSSLFEIVPKKAKSMSKTFNTMIKWREAPVVLSGGSGGGGSNTPGRRLTRNLHNLLIVFATQQGNICQEGKQHKENKEDLS